MNNKIFTFWNRITAAVLLFVSATVYLLTIEPTASFWDCGEFIASSYKLEVGHPPGNPVFQLFGFADVNDLCVGAFHYIHTRGLGQRICLIPESFKSCHSLLPSATPRKLI